MPPPRFVRRSSTSSFRRVSFFSANAGAVSAAGVAVAAGAGAGEDEARGTGDALVPARGVGAGDKADVAGRGRGVCLAIHHSHATNPTTQNTTTIHAVRSIKLVAPVIHRPAFW